jgi:hypothetical protein
VVSVGGVIKQWHPGAGDGVGLQGGEGFGEAGGQGHDAQRKPLGLGEIRRIAGAAEGQIRIAASRFSIPKLAKPQLQWWGRRGSGRCR